MVGIMAAASRERVSSLIDSIIFAADIPSKLESLRQLKKDLSKGNDTVLVSEFLSSLLKFLSDPFSPVRKCLIEIIGEIGLRHLEFLPEIVPALVATVDDDTPAVARQAITSGTDIFCCTLEKIAIQGLHTSELDDSLESAWTWMLKLKEKIYSIASQPGSDGRRLLALKFVAAIILIYTPDPNGSSEPPHLVDHGEELGFNISWLRRGHPVLKVGDLSIEASQSLALLLDQLRLPIIKSLSTSMVVVLVNCLSAIAVKRPSFYGRILSVLLSLDPSNSAVKGLHAYGVLHALKNAFLSCLKCAHPSATPWRDRLVGALREMKAGALAEQALEGMCKINGIVKEEKVAAVVKEEQSAEVPDSVHNKMSRKRSSDIELHERSDDDDTPGKRARSMHTVSEEVSNKSDADHIAVEVKTDSTGQTIKSNEDDLGPVQQLVSVFGALIAQGEKAAMSLELLISSISADLLANVVIANLRNLPSSRPLVKGDEELPGDTTSCQSRIGTDTPFRQLTSFLANAFSSGRSQQVSSTVDVHPPASDDVESSLGKPSVMDVARNEEICAASNELTEIVHSDAPPLPATSHSGVTKGFRAVVSDFQDMESVDAVIPGLDNAPNDGPLDTVTSSSLASTDLDDASQDQVTSFGKSSRPESLPSMSTEKSEELSPKTVAMDTNVGITSTATSIGPVAHFVLPKISAPVIDLSDEAKDRIQKLVFIRILEAYKQVAVAGGLQLRFSLLACVGVEFPLDLDPWTLLQTHVLTDYTNHEGHELTLRVLYRLYGEAEEERDFFSSTTATSVYETFLLKVVETLRDSFPASDKSLSRLLAEVPYLPKLILKLLGSLCSPENGGKDEKEAHSGDRVTQGLSTVWSLILLRPTLRNELLRIALQSAVHHLEEVRMKAIRLVANKLYPLPSIALQIEEYAKDMLLSVVERHTAEITDAENSNTQLQKNLDIAKASNDQATVEMISKEPSAHATELSTSGSISVTSISEAQRCMSLYFALCTKKHTLLHQIFVIYKSSPESVKQAVHRHMPILIRTLGASPALLEIISDPPDGSENLLMQVLRTLTDGIVPSSELIFAIKKLYESKMKDIEILFPILSYLPKDEVLKVFPRVVNLPQDKFQAALARLLQGSPASGPVLTAPEILIAIHGIDPERDGIPLKKITDACNACFEQKQIFTQQVIANVLNQLVQQIPLPLLFMRTVLQAIGAFPALVDFIMEILSRLVSKQIWKYPKLWVGFLKCAQLTQPHSFGVLFQLPPTQLESALNKIPALKAPLAAHAIQTNVKSTLQRPVLVILGIASDSQAGSQSQSAPPAGSQSQSAPPAGSQSQSAQSTQPAESQSQSAQPAGSQSQSGQPAGSQSQSAQPAGSQSQCAQPAGSPSQSAQPAGSPSQCAQPAGSPSQSAQPAGSRSQSAQPAGSQSQSAQPAGSQSHSAHPDVTDTSSSDKDVNTEKSKESPSGS